MLRAAWVTLPLTAGTAASEVLRGWSDGPRIAAEALLWVAWAVGLLATFAPRPQTLTAVRVVAPAFVLVAIAVAFDGSASTAAVAVAIVATLVCAVLVAGADLACAAANALAYGDEVRYPLRVPPALFLGPVPLARVVVAAAVVAPILLLADGKIVLGIALAIVAVPLLYVLGRALSSLSRRWAVLVPAGFVVVDPFTLADPVLFLREHVRELAAASPGPTPPSVLDLRLGAGLGSLRAQFDEPIELVRAARGRHGGDTVRTDEICIAVVRRDEMLRLAGNRRLRVR